MNIYIPIIFVSIGLISCLTKNKEKPEIIETATQDLKMNDIVHDSLTDLQIKDIEKIQKVFSEVNTSSLEETISNFKRDQNPDNEIAIWLKMAKAYQQFTLTKRNSIGYDKKKEAYELILLRSMMSEEEVMEKVIVKFLTNDEVKEVFGYYETPPQPVKVEKR